MNGNVGVRPLYQTADYNSLFTPGAPTIFQ